MAKNYSPGHKAADFPRMDLTQPSQFRVAVRNVNNVRQMATPSEEEAGKLWYPKVHDATAKGARHLGVSHLAASGLVAAVSPNMDWSRNNIDAFHEMGKMSGSQWDAVRRSAESGPQGSGHRRSQEATDALRGTSLSTAADSALHKAHRLLQGEDPDEVLRRQTSPKTNSFMHNIHDPSGSSHVTIDGRAHDIARGEMWPWTYSGRGISSAATKRGTPTRYEQNEDVYHTSAAVHHEEAPAHQAITWTVGKRIETSAPTKSGAPRVKGVARKRQPYVP